MKFQSILQLYSNNELDFENCLIFKELDSYADLNRYVIGEVIEYAIYGRLRDYVVVDKDYEKFNLILYRL